MSKSAIKLDSNTITIENYMSKSLYAQYAEEREGVETIEESWGFATFKRLPDHIYLQDVYIIPSMRGQSKGTQLTDAVIKIGKEAGYTRMTTSVVPSTPGSTETILKMIHLNFKLFSSQSDIVYLIREI